MYLQLNHDTEPEWFPDPYQPDEDERRQRLLDDEWWHEHEAIVNASPIDDLPF